MLVIDDWLACRYDERVHFENEELQSVWVSRKDLVHQLERVQAGMVEEVLDAYLFGHKGFSLLDDELLFSYPYHNQSCFCWEIVISVVLFNIQSLINLLEISKAVKLWHPNRGLADEVLSRVLQKGLLELLVVESVVSISGPRKWWLRLYWLWALQPHEWVVCYHSCGWVLIEERGDCFAYADIDDLLKESVPHRVSK